MEKKDLSDVWTGFTRFILLKERPPDGYVQSGERRTRQQTTSRPDNVWSDMWTHMSDAAKKEESKTKMGHRETKTGQRQKTEKNFYF